LPSATIIARSVLGFAASSRLSGGRRLHVKEGRAVFDGRRGSRGWIAGRAGIVVTAAAIGLAGIALAGCDAGPGTTPAITPGTPAHPRVVLILASEFAFTPPVVDLVPGETVLLQIVDGGVAAHEAVFGDQAVQDAWERAEADLSAAPPGPPGQAPVPSVDPSISAAGLRIPVTSGQRVDLTWLVPANAPSLGSWSIGCHIPGHLAAGMVVPIRFVGPLGTLPATLPGSEFGSTAPSPFASASVLP
jgi:uncharacterized cupredoxin-like copper-binding protein